MNQEQAAIQLATPAVFSNHMDWSITDLGLRITFGETPPQNATPVAPRMAVFIPLPIVDKFITALTQSWAEQQDKIKAVAEAANQPKQ